MRFILRFLLVLLVFSATNITDTMATKQWKHKSERTIEKEFNVNSDVTFMLDHKYGNVTITEGSSNRIYIKILIELGASTEKSLAELNNRIDFDFNSTATLVRCKTNVGEMKNLSGKKSQTMKINYFVEVPKNFKPIINLMFGNLFLNNNVYQNFDLNLKFGNFQANELNDEKNNLTISYGNAKLLSATDMDMNIEFGNLSLDSCNTAEIKSKYANIEMENITELNITQSFGDIKIEKADIVNIKGFKYGNIDIEELNTSFEVDEISFSKLDIECSESVREVKIKGKYTPIKLSLADNQGFNASIAGKFADLRYNTTPDKPNKNNLPCVINIEGQNKYTAEFNIYSEFGNITIDN